MLYNQEKNEKLIWWIPSDLTDKNTDNTSPKMTLDEAAKVFEVLKNRRLVCIGDLKCTVREGENEETRYMTVYLIKRDRRTEWQEIANMGWIRQNFTFPIFELHRSFLWTLILAAGISIFGGMFTNLGEDIYLRAKDLKESLFQTTQPLQAQPEDTRK